MEGSAPAASGATVPSRAAGSAGEAAKLDREEREEAEVEGEEKEDDDEEDDEDEEERDVSEEVVGPGLLGHNSANRSSTRAGTTVRYCESCVSGGGCTNFARWRCTSGLDSPR